MTTMARNFIENGCDPFRERAEVAREPALVLPVLAPPRPLDPSRRRGTRKGALALVNFHYLRFLVYRGAA